MSAEEAFLRELRDEMRDEISSLRTSVEYRFGVMDERFASVQRSVDDLRARPAPGIPVWVVIAVSAPGWLVGLATVAIGSYLLVTR